MRLSAKIFALFAAAPSVSLAHGVAGNPSLTLADIATALLLGAAWLAYVVGSRRATPAAGRAGRFHLATALALLAAFGPLDAWAARSAALHMVQHMLLVVAIAPLWVLARPLPQWRAALGGRRLWAWPARTSRRPLAMALLHGAALWFWHAPRPYALALQDPVWHAIEHAFLLVTAALFWSAVLHAGSSSRGQAMLALLLTVIHTGLLGALLTFARLPLYGDARDLADQQLAGLIMWVPAGFAYVFAAAHCGRRWMRRGVQDAAG